MKKIYLHIILALNLLVFSCEEERSGSFNILTEEIVNVSGERVIVMGRIIAFQNIPMQDHGFYISNNESFNQPIIHSMGQTDRPGRFAGEISGLNLGVTYFAKAFVVRDGEILFGNTLTFETLGAVLDDFQPRTQFQGEIVTITGRNFADDVEVFFGDQKAEIVQFEFGFRLRVRVPPFNNEVQVPIKVITRGSELSLDFPFNYVTGKYTLLESNLGEFRLVDNIFFQQEDRFFIGLGMNINRTESNFLWEYIPSEGLWKKEAFPFSPHRRSANSRTGFFGGGFQDVNLSPKIYNDNYWYFDGNNFMGIPSSPFEFASSFGFMAQGQFYIAGGTLGVGSVVYRYNPETMQWQIRPNLPFNVDTRMVYFVHDDKLYWIDLDKVLREYDLFTAQTRIISEYPSPFIDDFSDTGGTSIVIGDKVYIGLYNNAKEFWELDMRDLVWTRKTMFPGNTRATNAGIFQKGGKIYFLRTPEFESNMQFWEFDPDGL
ncbi:IPT/TIG domain-containing protein [Shivajiella indica]|uniref:IPT/TIG domain-containing protein n=1 Tax=Shivajiella indica TaxID=872115 RepID=A0ABW5BBX5_9BACT